MVQIWWTS